MSAKLGHSGTAEGVAAAPTLSLPGRVGMWAFKHISEAAPALGRPLQRVLIRTWYSALSARAKSGDDVIFLNYGYAALDAPPFTGESSDVDEQYGSALYRRVAGARELRGKDVLEVGCGRGGGSSFVARRLGTRSMTGVDFAPSAVAFCRRRHKVEGLTFLEGNAEQLPFEAASFDAVLNVESSHCYPSFERFLQEVKRVLRPGGVFLFADLRGKDEAVKMREQLAEVFTIVEEERITPNVFKALELYSEHREAQIRERVPALFQTPVRNFAAVKGTAAYEALRRGDLEYLRFVMTARDAAPPA